MTTEELPWEDADWRSSPGNPVQVAFRMTTQGDEEVALRNGDNPDGVLVMTGPMWDEFVEAVRRGTFDDDPPAAGIIT